MKVYIATINTDNAMVAGVFSTLEKAKAACGTVNWRTEGRVTEFGTREWEGHRPTYGHCRILETDIDHQIYRG